MLSVILILFLTTALLMAIAGLYHKNNNRFCKSRKRLDGKTVLVTGGTSGMGLEISTDLAMRGARVIIACPFKDEGAAALDEITAATGNQNVVFKLLDLASLDCVRKFANDILKSEDRLDILMNNAGVSIVKDILTADGLHMTMQINYYGHFLLTLLLLPLLSKTGTKSEPSRVVNTASVLHRLATTDIESYNKLDHWLSVQPYCNSKISFILWSREFKNRMKGNVVMNNADPGAVGTRIFNTMPSISGVLTTLCFYYLSKNPWEGAQTMLHIALDSDAGQVNGEFFKDCRLYPPSKKALDSKNAKKLWEESVRLVGLSEEEVECCFKTV